MKMSCSIGLLATILILSAHSGAATTAKGIQVMQLDDSGAIIRPGFPVPSCEKLVLFKTHKTGSTTMHSILTRLAAWKHLRIQGARASFRDHYIDIAAVNSMGVEHPGDVAVRHLHDYNSVSEAVEAWSRMLATKDFTLIVPIRESISHYMSHKGYYHPEAVWEEYVSDEGCKSRGVPPPRRNAAAWGNCWNPLARGDFRLWRLEELDFFLSGPIFERMLFVPMDRMDEVVLALGEICAIPLSQLYFMATNARSAKTTASENPRSFEDSPNHDTMHPRLIEKVYENTALDRKLLASAVDKLDADMSYLDAIEPVLHVKRWVLEELRRRIGRECADPPEDGSGRLSVAPYSTLGWPADDIRQEFMRMCHFLDMPGAADLEFERTYSFETTQNFVPIPFNTTLYEEYFQRLEREVTAEVAE